MYPLSLAGLTAKHSTGFTTGSAIEFAWKFPSLNWSMCIYSIVL